MALKPKRHKTRTRNRRDRARPEFWSLEKGESAISCVVDQIDIAAIADREARIVRIDHGQIGDPKV